MLSSKRVSSRRAAITVKSSAFSNDTMPCLDPRGLLTSRELEVSEGNRFVVVLSGISAFSSTKWKIVSGETLFE